MYLGVGFLQQGNPKFVSASTLSEDQLFVAFVCRQSVIDDHVPPLLSFEEPKHVDALKAELVEDGWEHT